MHKTILYLGGIYFFVIQVDVILSLKKEANLLLHQVPPRISKTGTYSPWPTHTQSSNISPVSGSNY